MARLGQLIWRGCVKETFLKTLLLMWTVFLFQGQELLCESWMPLAVPWFPVLCPAVSWGRGYSEYTASFQEQLGSLFSIPILVRITSGIRVSVWVSGVPRNVASTAVLGMILPFWLWVHLCHSSVPAVLHCFLSLHRAPVSHFLYCTRVFYPLY